MVAAVGGGVARWAVLRALPLLLLVVAACSSGARPATIEHRASDGARRPDPLTASQALGDAQACRRLEECGRTPYGDPMQCFAPDFRPGIGEPHSAEAYREARANCTSDAACDADEQCHPGEGCGPIRCDRDGDCPTHFACTSHACERQRCTRDAECGDGTCALGACYPFPGFCAPRSYCCPP